MRLLYSCGKAASDTPTSRHRRCRRYLARSLYPLPTLSLAPTPTPFHLVPRPCPAAPASNAKVAGCQGGTASGIPLSWPPVTVKP
jgi:hypothetical protein